MIRDNLSNYYLAMLWLCSGLKTNTHSPIIAQQTSLGWILTGSTNSLLSPIKKDTTQSHTFVSLPCLVEHELPQLLQRFWEQKEITQPPSTLLTKEEQECESHLSATFKRTQEGRYMVRLPIKNNTEYLGDSRVQALRTLKRMKRMFEHNSPLYEAFSTFLAKYSRLKHMEQAPGFLDHNASSHLPHHGVFKESSTSTKLRVVFNGSQLSSTEISLNDLLHTGPKLQTNIVAILLRW